MDTVVQGKKMEKRQFGKTDMNVSVLGFGGSEIGYERASLAAVSKLLNRALDARGQRHRYGRVLRHQ